MSEKQRAIVDSLTLRFVGEDNNGVALHELRAAHVAEVLQGLVGLTSDFDKAGAFHEEGPADSEVLVRPAKPGSFLIEVVRTVVENIDTVRSTATAAGIPSIGVAASRRQGLRLPRQRQREDHLAGRHSPRGLPCGMARAAEAYTPPQKAVAPDNGPAGRSSCH
ncbi:hypothetical protein SEA_TAPIOCA_31 [Mycobacterium phage Tapioca]|uniref:Uncharacterized protein n=1 Tax=Mycobacterium phage Tapioca TaxID=2301545 RepID=A0A385D426_9CAUD|nr:hypothetical protein KD934_gp31 [Mycobacterium phage Tapioca]AXQ53143.1 hypothetical protein SEA_TAPIOCA_31 [Mycobacterium phage Tapioca]